MKTRFLAMMMAVCMVCALLPSAALAAGEEDAFGPGPGIEEADFPSAPEADEPGAPEPWAALPMSMAEGRAAVVPTFGVDNESNYVFCNNTPVLIKEEGGQTYLYDAAGQNKYLDGAALNTSTILYGGSRQHGETEMGDTSITMESGTVGFIYGGDLFSNRVGDTNVTINGGAVTVLYGGSRGDAALSQYGRIEGGTNVTVNGGTVTWLMGGGGQKESVVTGACYVTTNAAATVSYLFGGSEYGTVGSTVVDINATTLPDNSMVVGGGEGATSVTGDVTLTFSGTAAWLIGGSRYGRVNDTDVTLESGGSVTSSIFAGGSGETSSARNTKLTLAGGKCSYIYGGSEYGAVTGDVQIDVTALTQGVLTGGSTYTNVRAGGNSPGSVVAGNTTINIFALLTGLAGGGGYSGVVNGNATINVEDKSFVEFSAFLYYVTGQTNNSAAGQVVKGKTTLNLRTTPSSGKSDYIALRDRCWGFDDINLINSKLAFNKDLDYISLEPKNLSIDADSILSLQSGEVTVSGNFTGGGTLELTEGATFSVTGTTGGVTAVKLASKQGVPLSGSVKLIGGSNAQVSNYTLAEPAQGYTLVKKADGLYAVNADAVGLELSLDKSAPCYGDELAVMVQAENGKGVTTDGRVALSLTGSDGVIFTNTMRVDAQRKAVFTLPGSHLPGQYTLTATFEQTGLVGSATRTLTIAKRPLTLDLTGVEPFSRAYVSGNIDVYITSEYLAQGTLSGYVGGDSGAQLAAGETYLYRVASADAGTNKQISSKPASIAVQGELGQKYAIAPPDVSITITPQKVTQVDFAQTSVNAHVGTPLSERTLVGGSTVFGTFAWQDPTIDPPVGTDSFNVVFTPFDKVNYNYSELVGWDADTGTIIRPVEEKTAKKEKPTNVQQAKTYTVGNEQAVIVDLTEAVIAPADAGEVAFALGNAVIINNLVTNVAVSDGNLTFTIPDNAVANSAAAALTITVSSTNYEDFTLTVTVALTMKTAVDISGVTIAGANEQGWIRYSGKPAACAGTPVVTGGYTGELDYQWYDDEDNLLSGPPRDSDIYTLVIKVPDADPDYAGELRIRFQIIQATLTVRAEDRTITVGDDAPAYKVAFEGLGEGAAATAATACNYVKDDPVNGKVGTYTITPSGCTFTAGSAGNYRIAYQSGTLTVKAKETPPYSGGSSSNTTTTTTKNPDGSTTRTVTHKKTGSVTATTTYPDGAKIVATAPKDGKTSIEITVPKDIDRVTVTIPTAEQPKVGEVAVIIYEDGTREIVQTSVSTEAGMRLTLAGSAKMEIVDNSKVFADVAESHWAANAIQFAASRELFRGTGGDKFDPVGDMTRSMLVTVLARLDGQDTAGGETWYSKAMDWGTENGITDGTNADASITRESLVAMLYRYAKAEKADGMALSEFTDAGEVSGWATEAMNWAVANGILNGAGGKLNSGGTATRAEVAAILMRFIFL